MFCRNYKFTIVLLLFTCILTLQCKTNKLNESTNIFDDSTLYNWGTSLYTPSEYRASPQKINDLIHTSLKLRFNILEATVIGQATIRFKPHFYPVDTLCLDAVGFTINEVKGVGKNIKQDLSYTYNNEILKINLGKTYTVQDTLTVFIDYKAFPDKQEQNGDIALLGDRGLYFINKDGSQKRVPTQIWSQGETQSNSKWFPTIDVPNQRMTQDISLTVDKKFTTLSNGLLLSKKENADGTRTDFWKQSLPAAPYLTMIAIGEFAVVKDKYKNMDVLYYVEPPYAPYAKQIFGETPAMMAYFSSILGTEYVWEKYAQISVRDYVSGAMENTTATVHGEDIQRTEKELLDNDGIDVISHELFHHWFGNLVTCESWSNLPLNESFANYGEYLWREHRYGKDNADAHREEEMRGYFNEARLKNENMIRYYYNNREDMFDAHSYNKGGCVLHMLRNYVGDEAFFASLKLYLQTKKFSSAELADLRLAFESVTGEDLNWFFNQWFLNSGYPQLTIESSYNALNKQIELNVKQVSNNQNGQLFQLPVVVDVYTGNTKVSYKITLLESEQTFYFNANQAPNLVDFDADHMLLANVTENKSIDEWIYQYKNCSSYIARNAAIENLSNQQGKQVYNCLIDALSDKHENIRSKAARVLSEKFSTEYHDVLKPLFLTIAQKDEKSFVRADALEYWCKIEKNYEIQKPVILRALNDKSYLVQSVALNLLTKADADLSFEMAKKFENDSNIYILEAVGKVYTLMGGDNENSFFIKNLERASGFSKYQYIEMYGKYLLGHNDEIINQGLEVLSQEAIHNDFWYIRLNAINKIKDISDLYESRINELKGNTSKSVQYNNALSQKQKIHDLLEKIKAQKKSKDIFDIF